MIITEFYDGQGLGNQLWAYAVTRLIAHHKGCQFSIIGADRFKGKKIMDLDFGVEPVIENYYREKEGKVDGRSMWPYDPDLLGVPLNTKIDGNFQSYQYIRGNEDLVREWIKPHIVYDLPDNLCVVHCRMGDFVLTDTFLPEIYYHNAKEKALSERSDLDFVCLSDQPERANQFLNLPILESIEEDVYKAKHHFGGDILRDFTYLLSAKYLIISNSSFSWWASFLNTKKKLVIAPEFWAGYNHGFWQTSDIKTDGFTYV